MIKFNINNDVVAIIAPSSAYRDEKGMMDLALNYEQLQVQLSLFKQYDFNCKYDENIFSCDSLEFFANTKQERLRQFKEALLNPDVKIISAFRGGYGASEIAFDCLDIEPSGPKILVGFSDITVLHFLFTQQYNFPSIHFLVNEKSQEMLSEFMSIMQGTNAKFELINLNSNIEENGDIKGITTGGNLTIITTMIGTKLHPKTKNKILIIEEVGEISYRVHRYLLHMFHAGLFNEVAAVIFGDFTDTDKNIDLTINDFVDNYLTNIPVYKTENLGHGPINYPFTINSKASIKNNTLIIESPFNIVEKS